MRGGWGGNEKNYQKMDLKDKKPVLFAKHKKFRNSVYNSTEDLVQTKSGEGEIIISKLVFQRVTQKFRNNTLSKGGMGAERNKNKFIQEKMFCIKIIFWRW